MLDQTCYISLLQSKVLKLSKIQERFKVYSTKDLSIINNHFMTLNTCKFITFSFHVEKHMIVINSLVKSNNNCFVIS